MPARRHAAPRPIQHSARLGVLALAALLAKPLPQEFRFAQAHVLIELL